jgi:putative FmdB family regulatory protein
MPIYEYECEVCGHITEVLRRADERNESILCEECEGATERIMSRVSAPHMKGQAVKGETIGDLLDQAGVDTNSQSYKEASRERIRRMKEKND